MTEITKLDYQILCVLEAYPDVPRLNVWQVMNWPSTAWVSMETVNERLIWLRQAGFIASVGSGYRVVSYSWRDHVRVKLGWFERLALAIGAGAKALIQTMKGKRNG